MVTTYLTRSSRFCSENCRAMLRAVPLDVSQLRRCCLGQHHEDPLGQDVHAIPIRMVVERLLQLLQLREIEAPETDAAQGHSWVGESRTAMSTRSKARQGKEHVPVKSRASFSGDPRCPAGGTATKKASTAGMRVITSELNRELVSQLECDAKSPETSR